MPDPGEPQDLWVFGYGSLMWRPGFAHTEVRRARVVGWHRGFCLYSTHHRGTAARPGLVLGLDRGGACEGLAFRVPAAERAATIRTLRAREQISGAYRESLVETELLGQHDTLENQGPASRHVLAMAYLIERAHPSYAGRLSLGVQARLIRGAEGISGPNLEYLANTLLHLRALDIREPALEHLAVVLGLGLRRAMSEDGVGVRAKSLARMRACRHVPIDAPRLTLFQRRRFLYRMHLGEIRRA